MFVIASISISIGTLIFSYVNQVTITRSWEQLTSTAKIVLPRKVIRKGQETTIDELIKTGAPVVIRCGYNNSLHTEFEGYVARVKPGTPVEIECEDEMWKLKQRKVSHCFDNATLKAAVALCAPGYETEVLDAEFGPWVMNGNAAQELQRLHDEFGLPSFFRGRKLYSGLRYWPDHTDVRYHFQRNILSDGLEYRRKEDVLLKVKAISKLLNGQTVTAEVGDEGGDERTMHFFGITDKNELKRIAEEEMDRIKVDGYAGEITSYGLPFADHGDVAELIHSEYPERQGKYYINKVTVDYSDNGYRRKCELGKRAS